MKTILVAGASGFLGTALIKGLLDSNFNVIGISRSDCTINHSNFRLINLDICDYAKLQASLKDESNISCIVHLAAKIYYGENPDINEEMIKTNILGSYNIARLVKEKNIKSLIYASSMSVYDSHEKATEKTAPNPDSLYGLTKLTPEFFEKEIKDCNVYILRFSGIFGPGRNAGIIYKVINAYVNNKIFDLGSDGLDSWNPVYIDDAVKSIIFFLENDGTPRGVYNVGLDRQITVKEIGDILRKKSNKNLLKFSDKKSTLDFFMSVDKIKKLGFKFEDIEKSINKFYKYLKGDKI